MQMLIFFLIYLGAVKCFMCVIWISVAWHWKGLKDAPWLLCAYPLQRPIPRERKEREKSWEIITAWNKPRTWNTSGERHPDTLFIFSSFFSLERMLNWPEGNRGGKLFSFPFCATGASRKRWQSENYQIRRCQFEFHPNVDQKKKKRLAAKCTHKTHFDGAFGI